MLKISSTAYAETPFFKKLKNTSQKSTPSYGNVILQKHPLFHGNFSLDSAIDLQQGDPLGPALFAFAIHEVTSKMKADLNIWNLDDGCVGGDPNRAHQCHHDYR